LFLVSVCFNHQLYPVSTKGFRDVECTLEKNKIFTAGLAIASIALLVFGLVMAVDAVRGIGKRKGAFNVYCKGRMQWTGEKPPNRTTITQELGLSENATREEIGEALWNKRLSELGLTQDSTIGEYREAVKAERQEMREQRIREMREKIGLPENATMDDIWTAFKGDKGKSPCAGGMAGRILTQKIWEGQEGGMPV
jgi:hypothetical protein